MDAATANAIGFWLWLCVMTIIAHKQYMAGHDTWLFGHKTDEEKRIRDAILAKMERSAKEPTK